VNLRRIVRTTSFRLAALYAVVFALSVALLGQAVFWMVESALERHIATRIKAEVAFLESKFRTEGIAELVEEVEERMQSFVDGGHMEYLVVDPQGERLAGNLPRMPDANGWSDLAYPGDKKNPGGVTVRVHAIPLDDGIRLAVGDDLGMIAEINKAVFDALGWALLALIVLSLVGGPLLSLGFLRKVDAVTRTTEAIIGGNLARRIPLRGSNDEFDRLSGAVNRMLDHITNLMENLRQVSNGIAHDLRTPMSRLRQKLETAQAAVETNPALKVPIDAAIAETDGILETFSALLRISQIEAGSRRAGFREVDLSDVFEAVADAFGPAAEAEGKSLAARIEPGLSIHGDRELLTQMLANLIENAIRHTPTGSRIEMVLARTPSGIAGEVADNGAGVPASERELIFRRFYRLDRSRTTPGSGLGLVLVAAVADLHGSELAVSDNGPGLRVTIRFDTHERPLLRSAFRAGLTTPETK
jgi:signal transduction histidine kinase